MGFSQALSGLNAASSNLDVLGNNIANSQTVGYKSSGAQFASVFAGSKGLGTKVSAIVQDFGAGNIETTGRELDLAISGQGFYRFQNEGEVVYSRNGQLTMTPDGFLENAQGARIMGYGLSDPNDPFSEIVPGGQPQAINVPSVDMPASATQRVDASYNLDASIDPNDPAKKSSIELQAVDANGDLITVDNAGAYDADGNPTTVELDYHYSNSYQVYDSLGNKRSVTKYFEKVGDNQWQVTTAVDGKLSFTGVAGAASDLQNSYWVKFNGNGQLATYSELDSDLTSNPNTRDDGDVAGIIKAGFTLNLGTDSTLTEGDTTAPGGAGGYGLANAYVDANIQDPDVSNAVSTVTFPVDGGANQPFAFNAVLDGTTQFSNDSTNNSLTQDGYTSGTLVGITIENDGTVMRNYTNEQSVAAGQIVLANFRNPEGLKAVGGNAWASTEGSGQELVGVAGTGLLGTIESQAIETSNVDLAKQLVDMIVTQRAYQANSQTIKTQDEVLQASINLSR